MNTHQSQAEGLAVESFSLDLVPSGDFESREGKLFVPNITLCVQAS